MRIKVVISYCAASVALLLGGADAAWGSIIWQEDFEVLNPYPWGTAFTPAPPPSGPGQELSVGEYSTIGNNIDFKTDRGPDTLDLLYTVVLPRSLFNDGVPYSVAFDSWLMPFTVPANEQYQFEVKISVTGPDQNYGGGMVTGVGWFGNGPYDAPWTSPSKGTDGAYYFQYDFAANQNDLVLYLWSATGSQNDVDSHIVVDNITIATGAAGGGDGVGGVPTFAPEYDYSNPPPGAIPEPSSAALLGLGALGLAIFRRPRRRRQGEGCMSRGPRAAPWMWVVVMGSLLAGGMSARATLIFQEPFDTGVPQNPWTTDFSAWDSNGGSPIAEGEYYLGSGIEYYYPSGTPGGMVVYQTTLPRALFADDTSYYVAYDFWPYPPPAGTTDWGADHWITMDVSGPDNVFNEQNFVPWMDETDPAGPWERHTSNGSYFRFEGEFGNTSDVVLTLTMDAADPAAYRGLVDNVMVYDDPGGESLPSVPSAPPNDSGNPPAPVPEPASVVFLGMGLWMALRGWGRMEGPACRDR